MRNVFLAMSALVGSLFVLPVLAQEIFVPSVTTADPSAAGRQQAGGVEGSVAIEFDAEALARIDAALQVLVPEYHERLRRDGEASANDWIRHKSFELGQIEAERMKQRLGLN
jgi:hypothetical protein